MPFLLFCAALIALGAMGVHDIEVFSDLEHYTTPSGVEYLVARHQSLDPFEGDGFVVLHRGRADSAWKRDERRSGACTAAATIGEDLVVFHGRTASSYREGARVAHRDLSLEWDVHAAIPLPEGLLLLGVSGGKLRAATWRDPSLEVAEGSIDFEGDPRGLEVAGAGELPAAVAWPDASDPDRRTLMVARASGRGLGEVQRIQTPVPFRAFSVAESERGLVVYLQSRDDSRNEESLHQIWLDEATSATASPVEIPGRRLIGNRILGLGASPATGGRTRLFLSTLSSIRSFECARETTTPGSVEEIVTLTPLATGRILAWLAGLAVLSAILLWTGLKMFGRRWKGRLAS